MKMYPDKPELILGIFGILILWNYSTNNNKVKSPHIYNEYNLCENVVDKLNDKVDNNSKQLENKLNDEINDEINDDNNECNRILDNIISEEPDDEDNSRGDAEKIYRKMGSNGDDRLAERSSYNGQQGKLSKDIRANYNKYSFSPYLLEELEEGEKKIWWDNDQLDLFT